MFAFREEGEEPVGVARGGTCLQGLFRCGTHGMDIEGASDGGFRRFDGPGVLSKVIMGSYAHGCAGIFSDIDLFRLFDGNTRADLPLLVHTSFTEHPEKTLS